MNEWIAITLITLGIGSLVGLSFVRRHLNNTYRKEIEKQEQDIKIINDERDTLGPND